MDEGHQISSAFSWAPSAADLAALASFPLEVRRGMARCLVAIAPDLDVQNNDRVSYSYHTSVMHVMPAYGGIPEWIAAPGYEADARQARFDRYRHAVDLLIGVCARAHAL